jgi:hypothetical protein
MEEKKMMFADTITEMDLGAMASSVMSDCEKFGMTWGCRSDCPIFKAGKCKEVFFENIETFTKDGEFDEDGFIDTIAMYENKLTNKEVDHLFNVAKNSL